ncbi:MAG: alpha/beta hydrolase [Gaiellaceae bacterium]
MLRPVVLLPVLAIGLLAVGLTPRLLHDRNGPAVRHFTLRSALLGRSLDEILVTPASGGKGRPLLVLLHGYGATPDSWLTQAFDDAYASLGRRAPDVLLVNGDVASWYHDRAEGRWGSYVLQEAIPAALTRAGADRTRIAVGGISMGGFGALNFAVHEPGRFCAVGGHSAALWVVAAQTPYGAFDDARDFARNDVIGLAGRRAKPFGSTRVWLDVGRSDPFLSADRRLAGILRHKHQPVSFHTWPGGHEGAYWDAHMESYLSFYAGALAACKGR